MNGFGDFSDFAAAPRIFFDGSENYKGYDKTDTAQDRRQELITAHCSSLVNNCVRVISRLHAVWRQISACVDSHSILENTCNRNGLENFAGKNRGH